MAKIFPGTCEACVWGEGEHTGPTPLVRITDALLVDLAIIPKRHWHRDYYRRCWWVPEGEQLQFFVERSPDTNLLTLVFGSEEIES